MSEYGEQSRLAAPAHMAVSVAETIVEQYDDDDLEALVNQVNDVRGYGGGLDEGLVSIYRDTLNGEHHETYKELPEILWGAELIAGYRNTDADTVSETDFADSLSTFKRADDGILTAAEELNSTYEEIVDGAS